MRVTPWMLGTMLLLAGCGSLPQLAPTSAVTVRASDVAPKVENFKQVNDDLYRGGLPTEADLSTLHRMGVKTDIDLMGAPKQEVSQVNAEREAAAKAGVKFVSIPLPPWGEVPRDMVQQFLDTVSDPKNQPVYVHCFHGRDRTGTMVAAYRIAFDHYTGEQALAEMQTFGFKSKDYPYFAKFVLNFDGQH